MLVVDHGSFSQIAKLDSHYGFRDAIKIFKTNLRDVPVAHNLRGAACPVISPKPLQQGFGVNMHCHSNSKRSNILSSAL